MEKGGAYYLCDNASSFSRKLGIWFDLEKHTILPDIRYALSPVWYVCIAFEDVVVDVSWGEGPLNS